MEPGDKLLGSTPRGDKLLRCCGDELRGSRSRGCSCAGAAQSTTRHKMGKVATSPLPPRGSPPLRSGGQNQKWPINGQGGYITPAASGIPSASERGAKSKVAHKWARWLHHP